MKPITVTKELKEAVEDYQDARKIQKNSFTQYCHVYTDENAMAHEAATSLVLGYASQIEEIVENHFKGEGTNE